MTILNNLVSGAARSLRSLKWILIIWISTLVLAGILVLPVKAAFASVLGRSMITDRLKDGIDIDVLVDFGRNMLTIISSLSVGLFLVIISGFLLNVFLNSGLFNSLRYSENKFSASHFFGGAGGNFLSFLVITLIVSFIIHFMATIMIGIPVFIAIISRSEGAVNKTFIISTIAFLIVLPVFLLIADYARAWQSASSEPACIKAIAIGFKKTFRHFFPSYIVMSVTMIIQLLFTWLAFSIVSGFMPVTEGGVFLLFLLSQLLFIFKVLLRTWRYGSVTAMLETQSNSISTI